MSEETVPPNHVKAKPKVFAEMPDNINSSHQSNTVVKLAINSVKDEEGKQMDFHTSDSDKLHTRRPRPNTNIAVPSRYLRVSTSSCHDKCKSQHNTSEMKSNCNVMKSPLLTTLSEGKGLMIKPVVRRSSFPEAKADKESEDRVIKANRQTRMVELNENPLEIASDKVREIHVTKAEKKPMNNAVRFREFSTSSHHPKNLQSTRLKEAKAKQPEVTPEKTLYMIEPNSFRKPADTFPKSNLHSKRIGERLSIGTKQGSEARHIQRVNFHLAKSNNLFSDCKSKPKTQKAKPSTSRTEPGSSKGKESKLEHNGCEKSHLHKSLLHGIDKPCKSEEQELREIETLNSNQSDSISRDTKINTAPKAKVQSAGKGQAVEEVGSDSSWMMKFRRGKVVDLPNGDKIPVKLKFKTPRSLNSNEDVNNTRKVSYRSKQTGGEDTRNNRSAESEKVVLRHQEAAGKKNGDVDVNYVIEETVSKLVKTRKSKVKALVGAFETVISLKDHNAMKAARTSTS